LEAVWEFLDRPCSAFVIAGPILQALKIGELKEVPMRRFTLLRDPANPPEFAHPLARAPFVLTGEGGAGR
jgi:hypothetical protein